MNLYVAVAFPPSILKLQCSAMLLSRGIWLYACLRSILLNHHGPSLFLLDVIFIASESVRSSILCIWCLFLWIALFSSFESSAIFIDLSFLTVNTSGLMKKSSGHFSNRIIWLSLISFCNSFSTFSTRCKGTLLPLCCVGVFSFFKMDFGIWFLLLPSLVQMWGYFLKIHFVMFWSITFSLISKIFLPLVACCWVRVSLSFVRMTLPIRFCDLCFTTRMLQFLAVHEPDRNSIWIWPMICMS